MGKQVIATSAAFEGISYDEKLAISVVDEANVMANKISVLLQNKSVIFSNANRDFVKEKFSWQQNVNQLSALLNRE
jgi:glycosyltransferase involved in cell wall biosynthesis